MASTKAVLIKACVGIGYSINPGDMNIFTEVPTLQMISNFSDTIRKMISILRRQHTALLSPIKEQPAGPSKSLDDGGGDDELEADE